MEDYPKNVSEKIAEFYKDKKFSWSAIDDDLMFMSLLSGTLDRSSVLPISIDLTTRNPLKKNISPLELGNYCVARLNLILDTKISYFKRPNDSGLTMNFNRSNVVKLLDYFHDHKIPSDLLSYVKNN